MSRDLIRHQTTDRILDEEIDEKCFESVQAQKIMEEKYEGLQTAYLRLEANLRWYAEVLARIKQDVSVLDFAKWINDPQTLEKMTRVAQVTQARFREKRSRRKKFFAITDLQRMMRGFLVRRWARPVHQKRREAALVIQTWTRGVLGRKRFQEHKRLKYVEAGEFFIPLGLAYVRRMSTLDLLQKRREAATGIQRIERGKQGRAKARERKRQKKLEQDQYLDSLNLNELERLKAEKKKLREEEDARKQRAAEFEAETAMRQKEIKAKEEAEKQRVLAERKKAELKRLEEKQKRMREEKEMESRQEEEKEAWRQAQAKKLARKKELEALKEGGRKENAQKAMQMQIEERKNERYEKAKEKKRKSREAERKKQEAKLLAEEKRDRVQWLNREWVDDAHEVEDVRRYLVDEKFGGSTSKAFDFLESRMPRFGFNSDKFCDMFCRTIQFCLVWRARRLFRVLDRLRGNKGELVVEDILGERPSPRTMFSIPDRAWSAASDEIEALSLIPPEVSVVDVGGTLVRSFEWTVAPLSHFMKEGALIRCAPVDDIRLEMHAFDGTIKCSAPRGLKFRGLFFVGHTKALPHDFSFRHTEDWKGGEDGGGHFDLSVEQNKDELADDSLRVGFCVLHDMSSYPDVIKIRSVAPGEENKKRVTWTMDNVSKQLLLDYYPRGIKVMSPPFEVLGIGPLAFELFPNGSNTCMKQKWCSIRLTAPMGTVLDMEFFCGQTRKKPPDTPHRFEYEDQGYGVEEFCHFDRLEALTFGVDISLASEDPNLKLLGINCDQICNYFLGPNLKI